MHRLPTGQKPEPAAELAYSRNLQSPARSRPGGQRKDSTDRESETSCTSRRKNRGRESPPNTSVRRKTTETAHHDTTPPSCDHSRLVPSRSPFVDQTGNIAQTDLPGSLDFSPKACPMTAFSAN